MADVRINKEKFMKLVSSQYKKITKHSEKINLYTVIRAIILAAKKYSYEQKHLTKDGIKELIMKSVPNVIDDLYKSSLITEADYYEIKSEYVRDKDNSLPESVSEFMDLIMGARYEKTENGGSGCIMM